MKINAMVSVIANCAKEYQCNLVNRNILFVFDNAGVVESLEMLCLPENFLHLTGVVPVDKSLSSVNFYNMCLDGRLSPKSIEIRNDGTTCMKLSVLSQAMNIHKTAKLIGNYSGNKIKLSTGKIVGNEQVCVGIVEAKEYPGLYVPNTILRERIRNVVDTPAKKILAIFSKPKNASHYTECTYLAKEVSLDSILLDSLKSI